MSEHNVIPGDFTSPDGTPAAPVGSGEPVATEPAGSDTTRDGGTAPDNAFFGLTAKEIETMEPLGEEEIKQLLTTHPRIARNFFNVAQQVATLTNMGRMKDRLLAGLIYQAGGKLTIDCLPMSKVTGTENFTIGEGRFKSTVIGFAPKMVSGSKTIIQG